VYGNGNPNNSASFAGWFEDGAVIMLGQQQGTWLDFRNGTVDFHTSDNGPKPPFSTQICSFYSVQQGGPQGSISLSGSTISYNQFTGSHLAWTDQPIERGTLVHLTGDNVRSGEQSGSEVIYGIEPCPIANDARCMGAYLAQDHEPEGDRVTTHLIMAVGNGDMWVANRQPVISNPAII
jgi:hypothetical protein